MIKETLCDAMRRRRSDDALLWVEEIMHGIACS